MDWDHGLGALGDECLDRFRVHVEVVAFTANDVAEDGLCAAVADGVGGGDESERWDDHLVPWLDPRGDARKVERSGAAQEGEHVLRAQVLGELLLERLCLRAGAQPAGAERRGDGFEFLLPDPHVEDRYLRNSRLHRRLSRWRLRAQPRLGPRPPRGQAPCPRRALLPRQRRSQTPRPALHPPQARPRPAARRSSPCRAL